MMKIAVSADVTATFIGLKQGMFTSDGLAVQVDIKFNNLDVPEEVYQMNCRTTDVPPD